MVDRERASSETASHAVSFRDRTIRVLMSLLDDLTVERDEDALLHSTLGHVVARLEVTAGITYVLGPDEELTPAAEHWPDSHGDKAPTLDAARRAIDDRRVVVRELGEGGWIAAAPLVTRDRQLGVLVLQDPDADFLPEPDVLEAIGKQIGTGLENVRQYSMLHDLAHRNQIVNRITNAVSSTADLNVAIQAFAPEMGRLQAFDLTAWAFVNESGDYLEVVAHPEGSTWGLGSVIPVVGSGPGCVVLDGQPVVRSDLLHNRRFIEDMRLLERGIRSYVLLPLNARANSVGALCLGSTRAGAYDESTITRLQPVADTMALVLENVRLVQRTRELSILDDVTPLYNYRFFHQIVDRELALAERYNQTLSLMFVDLDDFKPINDNHGHLRGSRVLREVGFLLRAAVRESDYPVRYGGDEFVVILPQTDSVVAMEVAERIRNMIAGHVYLQEEGINARLGLSVGVATYPSDARTKTSLVRLADERMYADKDSRKKAKGIQRRTE